MKVETDGNRMTVDVGPGMRQAALDAVVACFRELQKTRRLLIFTAMAFAIVAAVAVVFAPAGREALAQWIGLALLVPVIIIGGYSTVWLKVGPLEIKMTNEEGSDSQTARRNDR